MKPILNCAFALLIFMLGLPGSSTRAEPAEKRIALVIGNASYQPGPLQTAANDAGLIAQTLQAAGFDTVGARDLDEDALRHAFRDFVDKASAAGPDTVAFIYFSGYGLQLEGENYAVPVDAAISRDADIATKAVRISDYARSLSALQLKATILVLDAGRRNPFAISGQPIAGGLALVEPSPGMLIAFNAAPGTVAPDESGGSYGAYAQALAEMIRDGGLSLSDLFERVRLRVNEATHGAEVPWNMSKLETSFVFFERSPDAPPPAVAAERTAAMRAKPIRELSPQDAYIAALERNSLAGYEEFLVAYPDDPMAARVRAIVAARREALTWRRTYVADTPNAYWSYLRRYPRGPHAADARRRLAQLAEATEPPSGFAALNYDVPPPPPQESAYMERPVLAFDDPAFGFAPPPPPPVYFLPPPPPEFVVLPPPPPPALVFALPVPAFVPVPVWFNPPVYVAPPPNNIIFANIHNTVVVNQTTNVVTVTNARGQIVPTAAARPGGAGAATPALGPALPPTVAKRAALIQEQRGPAAATRPGMPGQQPAQQALPAPAGARPLPAVGGRPATLPGTPAPTATAPGAAPAANGLQKPPLPSTANTHPVVPATAGRNEPVPPAVGGRTTLTPAGASSSLPTPRGQKPPDPTTTAAAPVPSGERNLSGQGLPAGRRGAPAAAIHNAPPKPPGSGPGASKLDPALHQSLRTDGDKSGVPGGQAPARAGTGHRSPPEPAGRQAPAAALNAPATGHIPSAAVRRPAAAPHGPPPGQAVRRDAAVPGPATHNPAPNLNRAAPPAAAINRPPVAHGGGQPAAAHRACQNVNGRQVCQ